MINTYRGQQERQCDDRAVDGGIVRFVRVLQSDSGVDPELVGAQSFDLMIV